jgi:hypothetical protein
LHPLLLPEAFPTEPRARQRWPCGLRDLKRAVNATKVAVFFKEKEGRNLDIFRPLLQTYSQNIETFQNISTCRAKFV